LRRLRGGPACATLTTASRPRGQFSRASDPSVAYDAVHGVWLIASLGFSNNESALLISASYLYVKNKGNATFGIQDGIVLNNPPVLPIDNFDNSTQQYFNLKGTWNYNKNWSFSGGYSYAKYNHDDIATNGYQYTLPFPGVVTNTSLSYLNGYDAYTDGHSNLFYAFVTYRFGR